MGLPDIAYSIRGTITAGRTNPFVPHASQRSQQNGVSQLPPLGAAVLPSISVYQRLSTDTVK